MTNKRAKQWSEDAKNSENKFVKFILFCVCLESLELEGEYLKDVLKKNECIIRCSLENHTKDICNLSKILKKGPLENVRYKGEPIKIKDPKNGGKIDVNNIIKFIVTVRNNLVHGDKASRDNRDNKMVEYGNKLIEPIVEEIVLNTLCKQALESNKHSSVKRNREKTSTKQIHP